jgi:hypothetical protein
MVLGLNWGSVPPGPPEFVGQNFAIAGALGQINGVRAHDIETDHTGNFIPVSATITVSL